MKKNLLKLKKAALLWVSIVFMGSASTAAVFTASSSGNWSSTATWGGSVPSATNTTDKIIIPSGISVVLDNDLTLNGVLAELEVEGTLSSASQIILSIPAGSLSGSGSIDVGAVILGSGAMISFSGNFSSEKITTSAANLITNAKIFVKQTLTLASGVISIQAGGTLTMSANSTILLTGGSITLNGGNLGLTSAYNVHYKSGNLNAGLEVNGSGLNDLTIEVGTANKVNLAGNINVNGTLTLSSGTLMIGSSNLYLKGNISASGNGKINATGGNLMVSSKTGVNGYLTFTGNSNVNDLTVDVGNANSAKINGQLTVNGTLYLSSGSLQLDAADLTLKGQISAAGSGNISSGNTSTLTINMLITPAGKIAFNSGNNTLANLTINIADKGNLTVSSELTVANSLTLTSGKLDMSNHKLTILKGGSIVGAGKSTYVITGTSGSLSMSVATNDLSGIKFPIGTSASYLPAIVTLNAGSAEGKIDMKVSPKVFAQGTTGMAISDTKQMVNATWDISSEIVSNLDMKLKLMWSSEVEVNGFARNAAYISHYTNSNWDVDASAQASAESEAMFSISRNNIQSLSPFAVFDQTTANVKSVNDKDSKLKLFPNPAQDFITIQTDFSSNEPIHMSILNLEGQVIARHELNSSENTVDLKNLRAGIYLINLSNSEINLTRRLVKN